MKKQKTTKRKQCHSTLETAVEELECSLLSLVAAYAVERNINFSSNNNNSIWAVEQRIDFLKKLLSAEFASNPERTKHLRHISQRLHTLEEAVHLFVLESQEISHDNDTAATPSTFMFQINKGNLDTLSVCSCSNHDDGDVVDDSYNNDGLQLQDVVLDHHDHDSVLLLQYLGHNNNGGLGPEDSYSYHQEKEEVSCGNAATVGNRVPPSQFNYNDESSTVVEMEDDEEEEKQRETKSWAVAWKFINYWLLGLMVISCSGYYLFPYYYNLDESSRVFLLTPT